jgi:mono/diheme cytochrome c family protein
MAGNGNLQAAGSTQRFEDECGECHGPAAEFAADWLAFRNGSLIGTGADVPVAEFLKKHQGLQAEDIEYYVELLTRVAREIGLK